MKIQKSEDINGLILAGGQSKRMGRDKSLLVFHELPQKDHLFQLLDKFCSQVYTSRKQGDKKGVFKNILVDAFSFNSPLNAILSAFQLHPEVAWLTVPIDMPFVNEEIIQFLIKNRDPQKIATCFYDSEGSSPEPLLAIWEPMGVNKLFDFHEMRKTSPRDFLMSADVNIVKIPNPNALVNVNTPEEFAALTQKK